MGDTPHPTRDRQFFFIHLMKTAGTTFRAQAAQNFEADEVFPRRGEGSAFEQIMRYMDVHQFLELAPETRARVRFFSAHVPYVMADMAAPGAVKITVVRDPVERTLSYLRHCRRDHAEHRTKALEEIYEDPWYFARFIENHQTKMLSMTADEVLQGSEDSLVRKLDPLDRSRAKLREDPVFVEAVRGELASGSARSLLSFVDRAPAEIVPVDERRLSTALANLAEVDVLAITEQADDLAIVMAQRYGWSVGSHRVLNTTEPQPVPMSFRRRIAEDNAADATLYEQARRLQTRVVHSRPAADRRVSRAVSH